MTETPGPNAGGPTRFDRAAELFHELRSLSVHDRESEVEKRCGGDTELAAMVRMLLKGDDAPLPAEGLADQIKAAGDAITSGVTADLTASRVGNYKLLERIGEGGFGIVYLAEQERPVRRRVALKIIKLGMDTRQVVARFEAERQALAIMDHPNIAKVFDGGATDGGRPYFVMELVKGVPITQYCDENRLDVRARLSLFARVCDALQHAHQKGVIHRDIKPSNVLVSEHEGTPVPKVIDFGIAKATSAHLTEKTIFTEQRQMIGTPEYMSPEQAGASSLDIDTRTDVYSLGVLLYELLAGATPFDSHRLRSAAYGEIQRIIREEDPPRPSTRLTSHDSRASIAAARGIEPGRLTSQLSGELDWVVMKCLEKDRARRYDSAGALMRDVSRFITGEAVHAVPPSRVYRVGKFVKRNKGPVIAATTLLLVLLAGLVGTSLGFWNADRQREIAVAAGIRADQKATAEAAARQEATREQYAAGIHAAAALLDNHQSSLAVEMLNKCDESMRGWEWKWLRANADASIAAFTDHHRLVDGVVVSPDGARFTAFGGSSVMTIRGAPLGAKICELADKDLGGIRSGGFNADNTRILTGDVGGWLRMYDATTGARLFHVQAHSDTLRWSELSADGKLILTTSNDKTARIFDASNGAERMVFRGHKDIVAGGSLSPDSTRAVTFDDSGVGHVWNVTTGQLLLTLRDRAGCCRTPSFSPDGSRIVGIGEGFSFCVWDAATGAQICTLNGHTDTLTSHIFCRGSSCVLTASYDGTARLWDAATGRCLQVYRDDAGWVYSARMSRDGARVVTATQGRRATIWNAETGEKTIDLQGHGSHVYRAEFLDDDRVIVTCSFDHSVRLWDAMSTECAATKVHVPDSTVFHAEFDPSGDRFAAALANGQARIYSSSTGAQLLELVGHNDVVWGLSWSPDGKRVLTASADTTARVWDADTGDLQLVLSGHGGPVTHAVQSPDGKRIATTSEDQFVRLWDAATGELLFQMPGHTYHVSTADFSPDSRKLVTASRDHTARVWDVQTGEPLLTLKEHQDIVVHACFSPDGSRILTAGHDGRAILWDATTGAQLSTPIRDIDYFGWCGFSPDGSRIIVSTNDGSVKVWDTERASVLLEIRGHRGWVLACQFSRDGTRLLTTSADQCARVWHITPYAERYPAIRAAREAAQRLTPRPAPR